MRWTGTPCERPLGQVGDGVRRREVAAGEAARHDALVLHPRQLLPHVDPRLQADAVRRLAPRADVVHPRHDHPQPLGERRVQLVRGAAAAPVGEAVPDVLDPPQRAAAGELAHRADRQLLGREVVEEAVLVEDLLLAPALRAVELGDDARAVGQLHLVDPVLEGVERVADRVDGEAAGLDCGEHPLGGQRQEKVGGGVGGGHAPNVAERLQVPAYPPRLPHPPLDRPHHAAVGAAVAARVPAPRAGQGGGELRRLVLGQAARRLAEPVAAGGLGAVDPRPPLDDVEVELEDAPLRQLALELRR